tara:strand:+ start:215 stop:409 length:195 start_codon:yes stop_codon:yes gene_type:complete
MFTITIFKNDYSVYSGIFDIDNLLKKDLLDLSFIFQNLNLIDFPLFINYLINIFWSVGAINAIN